MGAKALNLRMIHDMFTTAGPSRAVTIHDAAQAQQARAAAEATLPPGHALWLLSAPGAALALSPRLFLAMAGPDSPRCRSVLDCGMAAGHALAALRAGCRMLVLTPCPASAALAGAAAEVGALLLPHRPPSLDMAGLRAGTEYAAARLRAWLAVGPR
jgi:hypothetical protein